MNRAAVLIGVNRINRLPTLNDAVRGAHRMYDWVLAQGFAPQRVVLITDESAPVRAAAVQEAIGKLLEPMAGTEQLLIYFAGHGLNISYGEFWLLSAALEWPTESVDVARSAVLARYSSVPHVVFISDACRTAAAGLHQQLITGSTIFPAVESGSAEKAVDQFFACTLGNPALEVNNGAQSGTFSALYTDALLEVLGGGEPTIIEVADDGEMPDGVIRPWPLKRVLREKVSKRLIDLHLHTQAFQTPDARITSDPGQAWIARLALPPLPPAKPRPRARKRILDDGAMHDLTRVFLSSPVEHAPPSLPDWVDAMLDKTLGRGAEPADPPDPAQSGAIVEQATRHSVEFEPRHFETRCGIKLRGGKAVAAIGAATRVEWVAEGEILRAHPASPQARDRVLLIFADGSGAVVPLLPEFIAELSFDDGVWVDLAYEVSEFSPFHDADPARRAERRYLREFVAAAVERGVFQPDRETLAALAARVFETPLPDPVLLLYLAYALDDAGMVGQLREMVSQMLARGAAPLFDVALLAYRQGDEQDGLLNATPGMPLLARGWAGLAARGIILPDGIAGVSQMLQPGLWSRFSAAAVSVLSKQLIPMEASHA